MSEVEQYWEKIRTAYGSDKPWNALSRNQQDAVIHSLNLLFAVLNERIQ
jgi:hypothetical protein